MIEYKRNLRMTSRISMELRRLRITGKLHGFYYLVYALEEVVPNPTRLQLVTKDLFVEIARCYAVSSGSVERAIRTAIDICWRYGGREVLDMMACHHLIKRPSATAFIDLLADYIRRTL